MELTLIGTEKLVHQIRQNFADLLKKERFVGDRTGAKVIEIINASFIADESVIFGTPASDWYDREVQWYLSQSLNINDIPPPIPATWQAVAAPETGEINSNYGWCVFSPQNFAQYANVRAALVQNPNTRQAQMIYTRPSMHYDWNRDHMLDFMCCAYVHYFKRENTLLASVYFRSNDAVYGFKGDLHWNQYVYDKLYNELRYVYPELKKHSIIWNAGSIHVYQRHWHLVKKWSDAQDQLKNAPSGVETKI